ncbi:MAG: hypothetical protein NZ869_06820 [Thermoanaerobaculum sp.]|nr:hypothetical protein [Thermoanaerobaculum sp.]MDW7966577.1 hypothetical protein [Thermoanaerobaculum sp.]
MPQACASLWLQRRASVQRLAMLPRGQLGCGLAHHLLAGACLHRLLWPGQAAPRALPTNSGVLVGGLPRQMPVGYPALSDPLGGTVAAAVGTLRYCRPC